MENERDFKGVWIPREIWLNPELSWSEKLLLVEIDSLDRGPGGCFASNEYFAKFLGVSDRQVKNYLQGLRKGGYIETAGFDGRKRFIKSCVKVGVKKTSPETGRKLPGGGEENFPLITTTDNSFEAEHSPENDHVDTPINTLINTTERGSARKLTDVPYPKTEKEGSAYEDWLDKQGAEETTGYGGEDVGEIIAWKIPGKRTPISDVEMRRRYERTLKTKKFDFTTELEKLRNSSFRPNKVIYEYWNFKDFSFTNYFQYKQQFDRDIRAAKMYADAGYDKEFLKFAMNYCESNYDVGWSIETVLKKANDLLKKYGKN